jgi:hypothetical protein
MLRFELVVSRLKKKSNIWILSDGHLGLIFLREDIFLTNELVFFAWLWVYYQAID